MLTTLQAFIQEKGRLKKHKIKKKKIFLSKSLRVLYMFFFFDLNQNFEY